MEKIAGQISKFLLLSTTLILAHTSQGQSDIRTEIDPEYIYEYEQTKFVPPADKTLLILGQTLGMINEYRFYTEYKKYPAGWSAYWSVTEFSGFDGPWATISGDTQDHHFLTTSFDNMVIHSAMWMVGKWNIAQRVIDGGYDEVIKQYCDWAKSIDRPIYLRIGYEFDGPHNQFLPDEYISAYKHVVDLMRSEGVTNVAYVWHSYASTTYRGFPVTDWYPGDEYVDWVAISVFFQPYEDISNHTETNQVLDWARERKKPVMIAEANPVLGIDRRGTRSWETWFENFFSFCYEKNIKAICFINENWNRLNIDGIEEWEDARFYNNAKMAEAWFAEIEQDRYLKQSPELYELLGYQ